MRAAVLVALLAVAMGSAAGAVDVTSCGQVVPPQEVGNLIASLECSGAASGSTAVVLGDRSVLNMNGFAIVGPPFGTGISCDGATRCTINGPGFVIGASPLDVAGVGIASEKNVTINGDAFEIYRNAVGVEAPNGLVKISDAVLRENGTGIVAKVVKAENLRVLFSERVGISAANKVSGKTMEILHNGWAGIETRSFRFDGLNATGNGSDGTTSGGAILATRRGVLRNSLLGGNSLDEVSVDIISGRAPRLIDSTCFNSAMLVDGLPTGTWGVCSAD